MNIEKLKPDTIIGSVSTPRSEIRRFLRWKEVKAIARDGDCFRLYFKNYDRNRHDIFGNPTAENEIQFRKVCPDNSYWQAISEYIERNDN